MERDAAWASGLSWVWPHTEWGAVEMASGADPTARPKWLFGYGAM